jgi:excinuclease UvrABC helicase subunit UvrB
MSPAMKAAITQTLERRERQHAHNVKNNIVPKSIVKELPKMNSDIDDLIAGTSSSKDGKRRLVAKKGGRKEGDWAQNLNLGAGAWAAGSGQDGTDGKSIGKSNSQLENLRFTDSEDLSPGQRQDLLSELKSAMQVAAKSLDFEEAARLRDRIFALEQV